ncbi:MAG: UDP-N-acetylmuramoylalanyl-D-glutamyl-2, 6-diaminopimelate--D-alanyl-D-alanine ligase, partial [Rhodospirillaceae bacterium]|nr:UDP-N-acetylmuramoylalanyl-D-glutamyl-2, 6-diaminopimelate--D-alanyl-D-alanine ligase [Rhodospirillaceae bacterium]
MIAAPAPTPLWTAEEAAAATDGTAVGTWSAGNVVIDSRAVANGDLFVALRGPNHDGHDYVAKALKAGAAAAMVQRRPAGLAADAPLLEVPDTLAGLTALGRYARLRSAAQVIGVTGSVGKTGTKEMLALALATQGPTFATTGNLNNHIGVPLTLARMPATSLFAVVEMGMNHANEIRPLSRLAAPHVAVITAVTDAHLESFRDIGGIADAKAEIFEGMEPSGTAVLNREDGQFARLLAHARTAGLGRIWTFGRHESCDARLLDASLHAT